MNNILKQYLENRFTPEHHQSPAKAVKKTYGPVVTISREYGCPAKKLASELANRLNEMEQKKRGSNPWIWIGKEIMERSANELHLKPELIRDVANKDHTNVIDDILLAFSNKYYPGDLKIKKTIGEIIREYAKIGRVIVVGRGGVAICRDMPKSLHIKLFAPFEWRVNDVSKRQMITLEEAEKRIKDIDHKRELLRDFFSGNKKFDDTMFDIIFNYYTCSEEEILEGIIKMMEMRDLI